MNWRIHFDGECVPNPGQGSCAYKAECLDTGKVLFKSWCMVGNTTNNQAEWEAAITALEDLTEYTKNLNVVSVYGDSQLVIEQLNGRYNVNNNRLRLYYKRWLTLRNKYPDVTFTFRHIYRENNTEMDAACKQAR